MFEFSFFELAILILVVSGVSLIIGKGMNAPKILTTERLKSDFIDWKMVFIRRTMVSMAQNEIEAPLLYKVMDDITELDKRNYRPTDKEIAEILKSHPQYGQNTEAN